MNITQIGQLILSGLMAQIPEDTRLKIIKLVLESKKKVVKFVHGEPVYCPVCETFQKKSVAGIVATNKEIRYCSCKYCTATFTAVGDIYVREVEPEIKVKYKHRRRK